ncbi:cysteine peptidase family C39 domain-containing protein [Sedimentitalea todarodis]|uniref:Cysteine peptidase family C39 domain-containing protein n=1 Tax=Sedimentitalea todarodis TaxID=1631240 RepID=A0ABU3VAX0_9RHOB|nr:cysteine peptidase family C39 domain-containing protein [Sedimentitalea todarodis]MDU9003323.1 cysteine peptidase family C39 domain-containing protein [Sedimentitalea todarodis]
MLQSSLFWIASVWTLLTRRRAFVLQTGRTDCGVASALTLLNLFRRPANAVQAVEDMDSDRTGTSLEALRLYFQDRHGFVAKALKVPATSLRKIKGKAILHMRQQHYVVLLRASAEGVLVFDPAMGPVYYPTADFASLYSGSLLEVQKPSDARTLPARQEHSKPVGAARRRSVEPVALFIVGFATRLLECAILLCLVAVLYLVLNQASFPSLLMAFGLIGVCGVLLLVAHQVKFEGEDGWIRRNQNRLWSGVLRTAVRGRDLSGFRGRPEHEVSGALRRGLSVAIPQRSQVPAALGSFVAVPALLCFLSPYVAVAHLVLFGILLVVVQLDDVNVCRRSVRKGIGRYSKLGLGVDMLNSLSAPDLFGEIAKWMVIGVAGLAVLVGALPPVALMFWILAAMQIVPLDFRRVMTIAPGLAARKPVSELTASEVPLRRQRVMGPVDLKVKHASGLTRIEGITPLTRGLQQPDLTVREQRLIMADVVRQALENLPADERPDHIGVVRIFGPGQDATLADFEHLMIARESRPGTMLPVPKDTRAILDKGLEDTLLRDLHSCAPGDFPVFWDFRERLVLKDLQARLKDSGVHCAGHLTMRKLTLVEAA